MAKVTAPNLSMKSSGQVGHALVHGSWRGVKYVRSYAKPSNPKTTGQTNTRNAFTWLSKVWKTLNAAVQAVWKDYAKGQKFTDRNAFIGKNTKILRTASTLLGAVMSPGTNSGVIPAGMMVAGGSGKVTATLTAPVLPAGWTITKAHFVALKDGSPSSGTLSSNSLYEGVAASPYTTDIEVAPGQWTVFGFFQYLRDDGKTAYSQSIFSTGMAT